MDPYGSAAASPSRVRPVLVEVRLIAVIASAMLIGFPATSPGDEFGRIEGSYLFDLVGRPDTRRQTTVSLRALEELPAALRGESSALVIVETDQRNLAKLLVSLGMRKVKPSEKEGTLVPVLLLDRYETIDGGDRRSTKARGKEVMLFDGFQFDLDTGQVVPPGMGGDVVFSTTPDGPRLTTLEKDRLFTFDKPLPAPPPAPGRPSGGRIVQAGDYSGRYHLVANGQWSGTLDLTVDAAGMVAGQFRSDLNGSVYPVSGQVSVEGPRRIAFDVQFPQARQSYEGLLWSEGKNAIGGTLSMLERPYSFIAVREGASLAAEEFETGPSPPGSTRRIVTMDAAADRFVLDGKPCSAAELLMALGRIVKADPTAVVVIRVPDSFAFERVRRAVESIRGAGVKSIRLAPATDKTGVD